MIRKAKLAEIPQILVITKACTAHMISNGIYQWTEDYPSRAAFENDVQRGELYVLEGPNEILGGVVVSTYMDDEYRAVKWLTASDQNIYIHRLFVNPENQRQGHAQKLMDFAENYAKTNHFVSVRLDTFSQNTRNKKFYASRGYQQLGDIFFPKQSEHPFHCYELVL